MTEAKSQEPVPEREPCSFYQVHEHEWYCRTHYQDSRTCEAVSRYHALKQELQAQLAESEAKHVEETALLKSRLHDARVELGMERAYRKDLEKAHAAEVADLEAKLAFLVPSFLYQRLPSEVWKCPDCGVFAGADEDGCCYACGQDLEIISVTAALAAVREESEESNEAHSSRPLWRF